MMYVISMKMGIVTKYWNDNNKTWVMLDYRTLATRFTSLERVEKLVCALQYVFDKCVVEYTEVKNGYVRNDNCVAKRD